MPLRGMLERVLTEYAGATAQPLKKHSLAQFLRKDTPPIVIDALGPLGTGLVFEGSPGKGNWADVPWVSVFDPAVTTSATQGYYAVYLFDADKQAAHLSLNQGTTAVRKEFSARTRDVLKDRAELMRKRLADFEAALPVKELNLDLSRDLPGDYAAGHALGVTYSLPALPAESALRSDLQTVVRAYRALTYRGGLDSDVESEGDVSAEFGLKKGTSVTETRKYAYHRKVERSSAAARLVKKHHGSRCQACDLTFEERYGKIGKGFIEAHHLKPISTLTEGVPVTYNVAGDFAVLCSNCHRMIHRTEDPGNVSAFRALIRGHYVL